MTTSIDDFLKKQNEFSQLFYDTQTMSDKQKEEMLKTICLAMHHEVSELVSSSNFKIFDKTEFGIDKDKILYNSIDVFRYTLGLLNLYNISTEEFTSAFEERDTHLRLQNKCRLPEENQKVIVVDIDDVVCNFRGFFNNWLKKKYNINVDPNSTSYYSSKEVKSAGLSPESVFEVFISEDMFLQIPAYNNMLELLEKIKSQNIYIQLLTSRPENNLKCKYQTYKWLEQNKVVFDSVGFAPEKYIWLAKKDFYLNGNLIAAIDDSPKHAMEYATHDINVFVPKTPYNNNIKHKNIFHYDLDTLNKIKF